MRCESADTEDEFCSISPKHADIVNLYWEWINVAIEAQQLLAPRKLSLFDVEGSFKRKEAFSSVKYDR
jgi:hypothetical protein